MPKAFTWPRMMMGMAAKMNPFFQVWYPPTIEHRKIFRHTSHSGQQEVSPSWPPLICLAMAGAWGATRRNFWYDLEATLKFLDIKKKYRIQRVDNFTLLGLPWCSCNWEMEAHRRFGLHLQSAEHPPSQCFTVPSNEGRP